MYKFKSNKNLLCPVTSFFRIYIPPFGSTFNLSIPRHFISALRDHVQRPDSSQKRLFFFSEMELFPSYYSAEEDALQKKTGGKKEEMEAEVQFQLVYNVNPESTRKEFSSAAQSSYTHSDLVKSLNAFFDDRDPAIAKAPFYIDWIVVKKALNGMASLEEFIDAYQNDLYDATKNRHDNILARHSALSDLELNIYVFPNSGTVSLDADALSVFRFRLFVAPKARVVFSNKDLLLYLGFTEDQLLDEFYFNQSEQKFAVQNFSNEIKVMAARGPPAVMTAGMTITTRVRFGFVENCIHSRVVTFYMPMSVFTNNSTELASKLKLGLDELADENNIKMDLDYVSSGSNFAFQFPNSAHISVYFSCSEFLAHRLGFGYTNRITKSSQPAFHSANVPGNTKKDFTVSERSGILCMDTGNVISVLENVCSNKTAEVDSIVMASLKPTAHGTMAKTQRDFYDYLVDLSSQCVTSDDEIILRFRLIRKNDKNVFENLNWDAGCFVSGCFEGVDASLFDG